MYVNFSMQNELGYRVKSDSREDYGAGALCLWSIQHITAVICEEPQ